MTNKKSFNLVEALKGAKVKTKNGNNVKVICETRGKILCQVTSNAGYIYNRQVKYNTDGTRWSPKYPCNEDLVMA